VHAHQGIHRVVAERGAPARIRGPMTGLAGGRKPRRDVIRTGGALVGRAVAAVAVARCALVDVVLVARRAGLGRVYADQRVGAIVVERRPPARIRRLVARLARGGEPRRRVVRAGGALVGRAMTAVAVARRALVDVVLVAGRAGLRGMRAGERVDAAVVERRLPARIRRPVAGFARGREPGRRVVRAGGALVVRPVTAVTVSRRALVDVVPVARGAGLGGVHPGERVVRAVLEAGLRKRGV